jgi:hypothetical protein
MGEDNYEMVYVPLPETYYLNPSAKFTEHERREANRKREDAAIALILETFETLAGTAGRRLKPPIKFRWIEPGGKTVWFGLTPFGKPEKFDAEAFGIAMVNSLNDVKVNFFLEFEGADSKIAKFCLRFT